MEVGLKAKVSPEVDDRAVRREAGRLRSSFEESLEEITVALDLSDVVERMGDVEDRTAEVSTQAKEAAEGAREMRDAVENMDLTPLQQMQQGDFAMDVMFGQGPAAMPESAGVSGAPVREGGRGAAGSGGGDDQGGRLEQGLQSIFGRVGERARGRTGQMSRKMAGRMDEMSGGMGRLAKLLIGGAAVVSVTGLALQYLAQTANALASTSPLLETVVDIFGLALSLFFRPFASILGRLLLPIAVAALQLAAEFNTVFGEEGIGSALSFLAVQIVAGLVNATLAVDPIGGAISFAVGEDGELGIGDALRVGITGLFAKLGVQALLSVLPKITGRRILNMLFGFGGRGLGHVIANRISSNILDMGITQLIRAGFGRIVSRIVPEGVKAFASSIAKALPPSRLLNIVKSRIGSIGGGGLIRGLTAKLPSLGVSSFLSRILPSVGVKALLGRVLPSIGMKAILSKVGLGVALKALSSKLVYFIPIVGQLIGAIDLLVFAITALIPGMEAFSPVMWTLKKTWEVLVWATMGVWNALVGLWDWITGISFDFSGFGEIDWLEIIVGPNMAAIIRDMFPDISIKGLLSGIFSFVNSPGMSIGQFLGGVFSFVGAGIDSFIGALLGGGGGGFSIGGSLGGASDAIVSVLEDIMNWFRSTFAPVLSFLQPVFTLLGMFAAFGMDVWGVAKSAWKKLKTFLNDPVAALSGLFGGAGEMAKQGAEDLIEGAIDIWEYVEGGSRDIWYWVKGKAKEIWTWVGGTSREVWYWIGGTSKEVWTWITETSRDIWSWVTDTSKAIWNFVKSTAKTIWNFVKGTSKAIWNFVKSTTKMIWDFVKDTSKAIWDFVTSVQKEIWDFVTGIQKEIWDFVTDTTKDIWEFVNDTKEDLWGFIDTKTQALWGFIDTKTEDLWDYVDIPNIDLDDYIDVPSINLDNYIDVPSINLGDYISRPGWLGGSAEGRVATSPGVTAVAESEPEVIVPFSKLDTFVNRMAAGSTPEGALQAPERDPLPELAEGGIVKRATAAVIGEGSDSEAVIPLPRLEAMISSPDQPAPETSSDAAYGEQAEPSVQTVTVDVTGMGGGGGRDTETDIAAQLEAAIGDQMDEISASIDDLARKIQRAGLGGPIKITADGKVLAEIDSKGSAKYKQSRNITR